MQLTISGHHVDVTPAIRQHVEGKLNLYNATAIRLRVLR